MRTEQSQKAGQPAGGCGRGFKPSASLPAPGSMPSRALRYRPATFLIHDRRLLKEIGIAAVGHRRRRTRKPLMFSRNRVSYVGYVIWRMYGDA